MSAPSAVLRTAHALANAGRFDAFRATCQQIVEADCVTPSTLLEVAALLSSFGFLSDAQTLLEQAQAQQPDDPTPLANLANVARAHVHRSPA